MTIDLYADRMTSSDENFTLTAEQGTAAYALFEKKLTPSLLLSFLVDEPVVMGLAAICIAEATGHDEDWAKEKAVNGTDEWSYIVAAFTVAWAAKRFGTIPAKMAEVHAEISARCIVVGHNWREERHARANEN